MAAYLKLVRKSNGEVIERSKLIELDNELCAAFGIEPHAKNWFAGWMNSIGMMLAMHNDMAKARKICGDDQELNFICDYIEEHFALASYYGQ